MSRKQKRVILYSSPLAVILALLAAGTWQVQNLQAEAEVFAGTGQSAIRLLNDYAARVEQGDIEGIAGSYAPGTGHRQIFWRLRELPDLRRDEVRVYAWEGPPGIGKDGSEVREQVRRLLGSIDSIEQSKFKLARLEEVVSPVEAVIRSVLWLRGTAPDGGSFESHTEYRMRIRAAGEGWILQDQELLRGRAVTGQRRGFTDVTRAAEIDFEARPNPLFSTPHWRPEKTGILLYGSAGVSTADFDNDGWYDIFFADGAGSALYRSRGDGTFHNVTAEVGLPVDMPGLNVSIFADFDNDGDKDVFLGCFTRSVDSSGRQVGERSCRNLLYRNNLEERKRNESLGSQPLFSDETDRSGLSHLKHFVTVASVADYNDDGRLDLYVGRYLDPRTKLPTTLFYTRNGEGNTLLRNDGGLRFTDVTEEAGVREGGLTLSVAWGDYDEDGDPDLYVANDFGRNALLENQGNGTFLDVTEGSGTLDFGFGMSAQFGDIDNDGDLDLYVSNVHSGTRWYGQATTLYQYLINSVRQGTIVEDFPLYKEIFTYAGSGWHDYGDYMVKGNSLFLNDGTGKFTDVAEAAGVNPFGWYWTSAMFDYDNDGRQDIYAANGWISGKTHDDL